MTWWITKCITSYWKNSISNYYSQNDITRLPAPAESNCTRYWNETTLDTSLFVNTIPAYSVPVSFQISYSQNFKILSLKFYNNLTMDPRLSTNQSTSLKSGSLYLVMVSVLRPSVRTKRNEQRIKPIFKLVLWLVIGRGSLYDSSLALSMITTIQLHANN